jgi:hypothetical protein
MEATMASFAWKHPEELVTEHGRQAPQDLETRYDGKEDIDREGVVAWRRLLGDLDDPRLALANFLRATQGLQRPPGQKRVFISHRMGTAPWAERIAWLSSQSGGLDYWLDVHDPVLRLANSVLAPSDPRYAVAIAAIIEMALLNCTHVIAMHTPPPGNTSWRPSQWIPYELARAKGRTVYSGQAAGWFHPQVHPPESRGEYVLLADIHLADTAVERWLINHGNPNTKKLYLGRGTPIPPNPLP